MGHAIDVIMTKLRIISFGWALTGTDELRVYLSVYSRHFVGAVH